MSAYAMGLLMDRKLAINIVPCQLNENLDSNEIDWSFDHIKNYANLTKEKFYISYRIDFVQNDLKKLTSLI